MANGIDRVNSIWAVVLSLLSALAGFGGAMIYVGGSLRQIDVNAQAIRDISEHGTGILQALKQQVQSNEQNIEQHLHAVDQRLDRDDTLLHTMSVDGSIAIGALVERVSIIDKRLAVTEQQMFDVRAKNDQRDLMQRDYQRDVERANGITRRAE